MSACVFMVTTKKREVFSSRKALLRKEKKIMKAEETETTSEGKGSCEVENEEVVCRVSQEVQKLSVPTGCCLVYRDQDQLRIK